jgi:hypothetical protein
MKDCDLLLNIGHLIANWCWLHPFKDKPVDNKEKRLVVSQKQQSQKWQPKDNPNGICSSHAFEALVIQPDPTVVPVEQS